MTRSRGVSRLTVQVWSAGSLAATERQVGGMIVVVGGGFVIAVTVPALANPPHVLRRVPRLKSLPVAHGLVASTIAGIKV
mmetsp:Transcript_47352/g.107353  ORF Transcript_47352/g.107353 Transcript_47352/m.107353 type:complete len:80 (+) Transcript_47352:216-455(+)